LPIEGRSILRADQKRVFSIEICPCERQRLQLCGAKRARTRRRTRTRRTSSVLPDKNGLASMARPHRRALGNRYALRGTETPSNPDSYACATVRSSHLIGGARISPRRNPRDFEDGFENGHHKKRSLSKMEGRKSGATECADALWLGASVSGTGSFTDAVAQRRRPRSAALSWRSLASTSASLRRISANCALVSKRRLPMEPPVAPQSERRAAGRLGDCLAIWTRVAQRGRST